MAQKWHGTTNSYIFRALSAHLSLLIIYLSALNCNWIDFSVKKKTHFFFPFFLFEVSAITVLRAFFFHLFVFKVSVISVIRASILNLITFCIFSCLFVLGTHLYWTSINDHTRIFDGLMDGLWNFGHSPSAGEKFQIHP